MSLTPLLVLNDQTTVTFASSIHFLLWLQLVMTLAVALIMDWLSDESELFYITNGFSTLTVSTSLQQASDP